MNVALAAFLVAFCAGSVAPPAATLNASAEIVAFVSLLMAGLLPAMILTATVLRGDSFSSSRVREYGAALRVQLGFWAALFLASIVSVSFLSAAKILDKFPEVPINLGTYSILPIEVAMRLAVGVSFGALAVIIVRLLPAYRGLRSILDLSVQMAELQALANDRSFKDALDEKASRVAVADPRQTEWPKDS